MRLSLAIAAPTLFLVIINGTAMVMAGSGSFAPSLNDDALDPPALLLNPPNNAVINENPTNQSDLDPPRPPVLQRYYLRGSQYNNYPIGTIPVAGSLLELVPYSGDEGTPEDFCPQVKNPKSGILDPKLYIIINETAIVGSSLTDLVNYSSLHCPIIGPLVAINKGQPECAPTIRVSDYKTTGVPAGLSNAVCIYKSDTLPGYTPDYPGQYASPFYEGSLAASTQYTTSAADPSGICPSNAYFLALCNVSTDIARKPLTDPFVIVSLYSGLCRASSYIGIGKDNVVCYEQRGSRTNVPCTYNGNDDSYFCASVLA